MSCSSLDLSGAQTVSSNFPAAHFPAAHFPVGLTRRREGHNSVGLRFGSTAVARGPNPNLACPYQAIPRAESGQPPQPAIPVHSHFRMEVVEGIDVNLEFQGAEPGQQICSQSSLGIRLNVHPVVVDYPVIRGVPSNFRVCQKLRIL